MPSEYEQRAAISQESVEGAAQGQGYGVSERAACTEAGDRSGWVEPGMHSLYRWVAV